MLCQFTLSTALHKFTLFSPPVNSLFTGWFILFTALPIHSFHSAVDSLFPQHCQFTFHSTANSLFSQRSVDSLFPQHCQFTLSTTLCQSFFTALSIHSFHRAVSSLSLTQLHSVPFNLPFHSTRQIIGIKHFLVVSFCCQFPPTKVPAVQRSHSLVHLCNSHRLCQTTGKLCCNRRQSCYLHETINRLLIEQHVQEYFFFLFCFPQLDLWGSPFWVRFLHMWLFFKPTIEVVIFRLRGWCTLGVLLLPTFTHLGHECQDLLSPCDGMHVCTG